MLFGLVEIYEDYLTSHREVFGRGRSILIVFSNDFGYSSLMFHQNSVSISFLKIGYDIESEAISINISCSIKMHQLILHFEWIF